jgi:hypothetical protein
MAAITPFKQLLLELDRTRADLAMDAAASMLSAIRKRVQQDRVSPDGSPYSPYSSRPLSPKVWSGLPVRSANKSKKIKEATKLAGGLFSYEQWRRVNNLRTDKKDFTFTGEMMNNLTVFPTKGQTSPVKVVISPRSDHLKERLEYNEKREGKEILAPSPSTIQRQEQTLAEAYERILTKYLS